MTNDARPWPQPYSSAKSADASRRWRETSDASGRATPAAPAPVALSEGWTKADVERYIADWCPDPVKDYIAALTAGAEPRATDAGEGRHGPKCWGRTSFSDEMAHCYCGTPRGVEKEDRPAAPDAYKPEPRDGEAVAWTLPFQMDRLKANPREAASMWGEPNSRINVPLFAHPPTPDPRLSVAVEAIIEERRRQVEGEGWTPQHDDEHDDYSLGLAAASYAGGVDCGSKVVTYTDDVSGGRGETPVWGTRKKRVPTPWPASWDPRWWKPTGDRRRDLVKAGALIVAEIERLDRAASALRQIGSTEKP